MAGSPLAVEDLVERAGVPLGKEPCELVGGLESDRDSDQGLDSDVVAALDPQDRVPRDAGAFGERSLGQISRPSGDR